MAEEAAVVEEAAAPAEAAAAAEAVTTAEEKLLPQSEVDRIVQERLARAAKGQPSKEELAELRAKAARQDEAEEASKTELEKAQAAAKKAEDKATAAVQLANDRLINAEAIKELAKAGVTNVDGALRALDKTGLTVEDDGTVSGAEAAVQSLLEAIPEFVGKVVPVKVDQGARGTTVKDGQVTEAQLENMSVEEIAKATAEGRMQDLLA
jgi:hypothetical protein